MKELRFGPFAALGHMPFSGHRTCAAWGPKVDIQHFAEALSKHGSVKRAAASVGKSQEWGEIVLRVMAKDMGEAA